MKSYIHIQKCKNCWKKKSLVNLSTVSAKLLNTLNCFSKIFFINEMIWIHSLLLLFHQHQQKINICYHINQDRCCPGNT